MSKKQSDIVKHEQVTVGELSPAQVAEFQKVENVATAMMKSGQQMVLAFEDILVKDFNFTEKDLKHVEKRLTHLLSGIAFLERKGLVIMGINDMASLGEIAQRKFNEAESKRLGIELLENFKPNIKQLKDK